MFGTNFGRELKMLGFKIILEICFHPQMFGTNLGKELKILGFLHILEICFQPPNVWHKYREGIKKKITHPRNMFPPPKYLAQISGQK